MSRHPAAWRGTELLEREDWEVRLSSAELEELERAGENADGDRLTLPTLAPTLERIQDRLEVGSGATRIRALPTNRWGEELSERIFHGLALHLGTPVSQSATGEVVFQVRDEGFAENDPRFRGPSSSKRLRFHTDRCDVIAFLCLKAARAGGETYVVSSMALHEEMRARHPELIAVLEEAYVYLRHTVDTGNELPFVRMPIFSHHEGHFAANLLRVLIERADRDPALPDMTVEQRAALDALDGLAEDPSLHVRFDLEPGDLLLLNNWVTFHRRGAFQDGADKRHLLRIWLSVPNSRPLDPRFREHFGATEAGALRGGMRPKATVATEGRDRRDAAERNR